LWSIPSGEKRRLSLPQVSGEKEFFANLVVDAVLRLDLQTLDLRMIGMKKVRCCSGLRPSPNNSTSSRPPNSGKS